MVTSGSRTLPQATVRSSFWTATTKSALDLTVERSYAVSCRYFSEHGLKQVRVGTMSCTNTCKEIESGFQADENFSMTLKTTLKSLSTRQDSSAQLLP